VSPSAGAMYTQQHTYTLLLHCCCTVVTLCGRGVARVRRFQQVRSLCVWYCVCMVLCVWYYMYDTICVWYYVYGTVCIWYCVGREWQGCVGFSRRDYLYTQQHKHTLLLHCCYTVVPLLFHCCYTVVTLLLHCCYTVVPLLLHCCFIVLVLLFHCCSTVVAMLLYCCYTVVTLLLHCCCTVVTLCGRGVAGVCGL
jgi:hypothetical protein